MLDEYINKIKNNYLENEMNIRKKKAIIHELNLYNFEDRIGRVTILSTLLYLPIFFGLFYLGVPGALFPGATLFTTFGLGFIGNMITEKIAKCKERFKNISKSKNESERLSEILRLEMDIERLNLRNEIIDRVEAKYNEEIDMIKKFSNSKKYSIEMKKSNFSKSELINKIKELESELKIKYKQLDILSDKSIIKEKKNSLNDRMTPLFQSMMCAFIPMVLSILPVFACIVARPLPEPSMIPLYTTFIPAIGSFIGGLTHFGLKKKNTIKAINLITKDNNKDSSNVYSELNKIKSQIANILFSLNTYKNELENYNLIEEYNKDKKTSIKNNMLVENNDLSLDISPKLTLK